MTADAKKFSGSVCKICAQGSSKTIEKAWIVESGGRVFSEGNSSLIFSTTENKSESKIEECYSLLTQYVFSPW